MVINYLHKIGWFIGLVLLQVLILNNVHIAGYATPFLYIYLILKFESETPRNTLMLWAFFSGTDGGYLFGYAGYECCSYGGTGFFASYIPTPVCAAGCI